MWWIQTTGYHLAGLVWLIVIAAIFVIAIVALSTAGAAASSARRTRRIVRDHEASHLGNGNTFNHRTDRTAADRESNETAVYTQRGLTPPASVVAEDRKTKVVENEQRPADPSLGDSMRILHERYARGEITREEYLRAREDMMAMTR